MRDTNHKAIAIVGVGAVLPDAPDVAAFWQNLTVGRYSISDVTADRWNPNAYYDEDRSAPDKTYSKIGGWTRDYDWNPMAWRMPIPPKVSDQMDRSQKWSIIAAREALSDFGYPQRKLDPDRTAVIIGNAMGGDKHYLTALRIYFPEYADELRQAPSFSSLAPATREAVLEELRAGIGRRIGEINEDTMPGELANIIAGRVANLFDLHGPNYVVDAACASAMAAVNAAIEGLEEYDYDAVLTGGVDSNMSASSFVKFAKIGALSATGTRPYANGADGFVMGEGAALFLLKRLEDAERDEDRIYAVIRGVGGSSDGKGKGITAPNPIGQRLAIERAWENAGLSPATASLVEGHGTSTKVGDRIEAQGIATVFGSAGARQGSIPLGSVKSNIGHLKGAAGAAGMLKVALALHHKTLPPSLNFAEPNPDIDFAGAPFYVNGELRTWDDFSDGARRAGVSAFGFGGTNFHVVLEEHVPGRLTTRSTTVGVSRPSTTHTSGGSLRAPLRGALVIGADTVAEVVDRLKEIQLAADRGQAPEPAPPLEADLRAPHRIAIDYGNAAELSVKCGRAIKAYGVDKAAMWQALRAQGVFRGSGEPGKVAFLYTGQGSQYPNMLKTLCGIDPVVAGTFAEADEVMSPILGRPLTEHIFVDSNDEAALARVARDLKETEITQPAVLATDEALTRLFAQYGIEPDVVMGHSLGEYAALVAAGALSFPDALRAVSARAHAMRSVSFDDDGAMAAVFAPLDEVERLLGELDGYVVIANINSSAQAVIGGATDAVNDAVAVIERAGHNVVRLPVSHAFHTRIVAPASEPLMTFLREEVEVRPPVLPIVANATGELYPMQPGVEAEMIEILGQQIASPVQFVKGLNTLYDEGVRVFVEVGPKRALFGFVEDVFGGRDDVVAAYANHPKQGDLVSFNAGLCALYAAGLGVGQAGVRPAASAPAAVVTQALAPPAPPVATRGPAPVNGALDALFAEFVERTRRLYEGSSGGAPVLEEPVVVTGASLGLPGGGPVFSDDNVSRLLHGEQMIDLIPSRARREMVERHITRLVKDGGSPHFETIEDASEVIKLAGRAGPFDLAEEFGYPADRTDALDTSTELAIGVGLDALRDAGLPLVMHYKTTTTGTLLPERFLLPEPLRDETGVIFAAVFPGLDAFAGELQGFYEDRDRRERLEELKAIRARGGAGESGALVTELDRRISELEAHIEQHTYVLDRRLLFRVLSMGHSQFAEYIGARGPNTQINAACASTTQAVSVAEDWIRTGRCRRVIVVSADNASSDNLLGWIGSGFLASGAAATDDDVTTAALPFDKRRHGMILGMGAAALVIESADSARERGIRPICQVLGGVTANSAFHGTRLNVAHIAQVMEQLVADAEARWGISRSEIASRTVFVSHETYTPARGGSAQAEVESLRAVFGANADQIVIANTKGFTGHAMGAGVEDVLAVKTLETGLVPPVANYREPDPELGALRLSQGGAYPIEFALRLGAGFGSQISMSLMRWTGGARIAPDQLGYAARLENETQWRRWLSHVSGHSAPDIEVVKRTLRVRDAGPPSARPAPPPGVPAKRPTAPPPAPAPAPAVAPAPAPAPVPVAVSTTDPVQERILALVAQQTGYPPEMLEMDLDLEADLGIDTVKQAEMFAAIRGEFDIERDENLALRDYPTLAHAVQFVYEKRPELKQAAPPAPASGGVESHVAARILGLVAKQTGYPPEMLEMDLDLEADLGIDTVKQAEMFAAIRGEFAIERDENLQLRDYPTLAHAVQFVLEKRPDLQAAAHASAPATATPAAGSPTDEIAATILGLVAKQTGYPPEMLEMDLDLEADLGIDTVKQAEMFAAIRGEFAIERDENLQLRDYPTLAHAVQFVLEKRPDLAGTPVSASAPAAPAAPTADGTDANAAIAARVMELVSEQTGYPSEMLEMDLDLEADLGIDTVKQAEMFANVRSEWGIPRDANLQLRDFPTLAHVVQFVLDRRPAAGGAGDATAAEASAADLGKVARRIAVPQLRPALDLCKPTGVRLDAARVVVALDSHGVGEALVERLSEVGATVLTLAPGLSAGDVQAELDGFAAEGDVHGLYWLPGVDDFDIETADHDGWRDAVRARVKLLHTTAQSLYGALASGGRFFVSAIRTGGHHGTAAGGPAHPLGGPVVGFTKAYKRERPDVLVKAVDLPVDMGVEAIVDRLIAETLHDPGIVEVGYLDEDTRCTVGLEVRDRPATEGMALGSDTVFVVTGAAGSIVSAITADLAQASSGIFYLLDLTPTPTEADDADLDRFQSDREGLSQAIYERLKAGPERATPALVQRELARIERLDAARRAIRAIEAAGGTAHYRSADLRDGEAVGAVIREVAEAHGRIDVLLHAAGLEISRTLPDKSADEFALVFDVKADGWFNMVRALGDTPIGAAVVFSSIAGRFGNSGQTDYSAANDLLAKSVAYLTATRPGTRGIALDWTAWGEIGMASRGSIPKLMAAAGIDMLPPSLGIPLVREELTSSGWAGEMVVAGALGMLVDEWDAEGGLDPERLSVPAGPVASRVVGMTLHDGLIVEATLEPAAQPFLNDHRIDGTPVLPGVMGIEAFAEAVRAMFPDRVATVIEDVHFLAPFKLYRDEPRTISVRATFEADGDDVVANCRLIGERQLPRGVEVTEHFRGRLRLSSDRGPGQTARVPNGGSSAEVPSEVIYQAYFHGPAYQVLDAVWPDGELVVGRVASDLPANHTPEDQPLATAPRLLEACFQTAGLWEMGTHQRMGLPMQVGRLELLAHPSEATGRLLVVVEPDAESGEYAAQVVDEQGTVFVDLRGYRTVELPGPIDARIIEVWRASNS